MRKRGERRKISYLVMGGAEGERFCVEASNKRVIKIGLGRVLIFYL